QSNQYEFLFSDNENVEIDAIENDHMKSKKASKSTSGQFFHMFKCLRWY
ncbi:unnamed protein product, partial [Rotaria socialis]